MHLKWEIKLVKKNQTFDFKLFFCKLYFDDDGSQKYLIPQPVFKYSKLFSSTIDKIFGKK